MTNAEKIKNMSTDELARVLERISSCGYTSNCKTCYLEKCWKECGCNVLTIKRWLESEAEE